MSEETKETIVADATVTADGQNLTLEQRVQNCEMTIGLTVQKLEEVLKVYMEEIQKTQRAVLSLMSTGTKKQQRLALPAQYRKPYLHSQEPTIGTDSTDQESTPLTVSP